MQAPMHSHTHTFAQLQTHVYTLHNKHTTHKSKENPLAPNAMPVWSCLPSCSEPGHALLR